MKFTCPCCDGEGGETEYCVTYLPGCSDGPYYPCGYCDGDGFVGLKKHVRWQYLIVVDYVESIIYAIQRRFRK
jgi:hypothetical protein